MRKAAHKEGCIRSAIVRTFALHSSIAAGGDTSPGSGGGGSTRLHWWPAGGGVPMAVPSRRNEHGP